jgi:hypothetical protein
MHRLQILLPSELFQALKAKAHEMDLSIGELVRRAVEKLLGGN